MPYQWIDITSSLFLRLLSFMPSSFFDALTWFGGRLLDRKKGQVARAAIQLALDEKCRERVDELAVQSAHFSLEYLLSLPRLTKIPYQLHNFDVIESALAEGKGGVIVSLHMGPPDLATTELSKKGVPVCTLIGAGKQSPFQNSLGRKALDMAGVEFIQRGDPTAVLTALKKKKLVFLYCDMRSREMPVTFFGQETSAPGSGVMTAQLLKAPILFHYCTFENNQWQLHFEPFEKTHTGHRKQDAVENLQRLISRMEEVIRQSPELWIWHYDRFRLRKRLE